VRGSLGRNSLAIDVQRSPPSFLLSLLEAHRPPTRMSTRGDEMRATSKKAAKRRQLFLFGNKSLRRSDVGLGKVRQNAILSSFLPLSTGESIAFVLRQLLQHSDRKRPKR